MVLKGRDEWSYVTDLELTLRAKPSPNATEKDTIIEFHLYSGLEEKLIEIEIVVKLYNNLTNKERNTVCFHENMQARDVLSLSGALFEGCV